MKRLNMLLITLFTLCLAAFKLHAADISPEKFLKLDKSQLTLLDVRTIEEYADGHIPTAINMPVGELSSLYSSLPEKDKQIVVYCRSGFRAARAISFLKDKGFTNVLHLEGDYGQWEKDAREIVTP